MFKQKEVIPRINSDHANFISWLHKRQYNVSKEDTSTKKITARILEDIRLKGDRMVLKYAKKFDRNKARLVRDLEIPEQMRQEALGRISQEQRDALDFASKRIHDFHVRQMQHMGSNWERRDEHGFFLGCSKIPLKKVGLYVPGGNAVYASTVLMCAIPAKIAGVDELIMMTPGRAGVCDDMVLAATTYAHIDKVYCLGGIQAIAAMAYGTETIGPVNKIVGPGNRYIIAAKSMVGDHVGIDTIAGPSELVIIADQTANPDWIVLDMFAQAEHDEDARVAVIATDDTLLDKVAQRMQKLLPSMERRDIIAKSLRKNGAIIHAQSIDQAISISDYMAPEHLSLMVSNYQPLLVKIHHAGAIFLGHQAAQVFGDYCAGPSHVLPTGGRARFDSGLNVSDFYRYSMVIGGSSINEEAHRVTALLARAEGLEAHALAVEARLKHST